MKIIVQARATNKTTTLIYISAEKEAIIICNTHNEVVAILKQAYLLKLSIPEPMTFGEFIHSKGSMRGRSILFDNADILLKNLCKGAKLEAITLTTDDEK